MVLKALFLLIILYYVVRTSRSLLRAVRGDGTGRASGKLHEEPRRPPGWQGETPSSQSRGKRDVEDAKWVDL